VVAGVGGQGILFATRLLEDAALRLGLPVVGAETHGMAQRGGSVLSHFRVGPYRSPLVRRGSAHCLLGMNLAETCRQAAYVRPDGLAFINCKPGETDGSPVIGHLEERGVEVWTYDADGAAMRMGAPALANVGLLGCASAHPRFPFDLEQIHAAVERVSPARFKDLNLAALREGHEHGSTLIASAPAPGDAAP